MSGWWWFLIFAITVAPFALLWLFAYHLPVDGARQRRRWRTRDLEDAERLR